MRRPRTREETKQELDQGEEQEVVVVKEARRREREGEEVVVVVSVLIVVEEEEEVVMAAAAETQGQCRVIPPGCYPAGFQMRCRTHSLWRWCHTCQVRM